MLNLSGLMALVLTLAVAVTYLNYRYIRLQSTIALMLSSLVLSLIIIILAQFGYQDLKQQLARALVQIDFNRLLMDEMLSFLLFAGALNININDLKGRKWEVLSLAVIGTILSTLVISVGTYYLLALLNIPMSFIYCLLFGALISPTDPIAVIAMCKEVQAPRKLEVTIAGESLFNDGVGIVLFMTFYQLAFTNQPFTWHNMSLLFLREACGGVLYGFLLGCIGNLLIKSIDDHKLEILLTLAIASGGYTCAQLIDVSGPLAMVVAGIMIGTQGSQWLIAAKPKKSFYEFWELVDEILNAMLFFLIGFELLIIKMGLFELIACATIIPLTLLSRLFCVSTSLSYFKLKQSYEPHLIKILTWGGLRGGLAIALALSIPASSQRDLILAMTYGIVIFSIAIQGLTIKPLIRLGTH